MASPGEAPTVTQTAPGPRRGLRAGAGWIRPVLAGLGAFLPVLPFAFGGGKGSGSLPGPRQMCLSSLATFSSSS